MSSLLVQQCLVNDYPHRPSLPITPQLVGFSNAGFVSAFWGGLSVDVDLGLRYSRSGLSFGLLLAAGVQLLWRLDYLVWYGFFWTSPLALLFIFHGNAVATASCMALLIYGALSLAYFAYHKLVLKKDALDAVELYPWTLNFFVFVAPSLSLLTAMSGEDNAFFARLGGAGSFRACCVALLLGCTISASYHYREPLFVSLPLCGTIKCLTPSLPPPQNHRHILQSRSRERRAVDESHL